MYEVLVVLKASICTNRKAMYGAKVKRMYEAYIQGR
jgi:hypothetical protein